MSRTRAIYRIDRITEDAVYLVDMCEAYTTMSVTNDAEAVTKQLFDSYGNKRFIYLDTIGRWDELVHKNGVFLNFKPTSNLPI